MMGLSFAVATERSDETRGFYVYSFSYGQGVLRHVAVGRPGQTPSLITRRRSVVRLIDGAEPVIIKSGLTEREAIALARELRARYQLRYRRRAESQPLARIPAREVR
jgi:hypothetical protein